jgi:hypothetical protein
MVLEILIALFFGFLMGAAFGILLIRYLMKLNDVKIFNQNSDFFRSVLHSIKANGRFIGRINNNVEISIDLSGDKLSIFLVMDRSDIAIFRGPECVRTSDNSDDDVIRSIVAEILSRWKNNISDVINMNGSIIDRNTYMRITKNLSYQQDSNIYSPHNNTQKIFILDDILDRINEVGFDNLSTDEKEYLKNRK